MNSRERIMAALNHRPTDMIPVDFGGHRSSGIMAIAYRKLRDALGLPKKPIRVYDAVQQLAVIDEDVLDRFGVDTVELGRAFDLEDDKWQEWRLPDGSPCLLPAWVDVRLENGHWYLYNDERRKSGVQREGSLYFDQTYWPYAEGIPEDLSGLEKAIASVMWSVAIKPVPDGVSLSQFAAMARKFHEDTERAVVYLFGGNLYEMAQYLCGTENFMVWMALEPEKVHSLLDALVELHLRDLRTYLGALSGSVDVVLFGDDFGMQSGPQLSTAMYEEFYKPRQKVLWNEAKRIAPVKVQMHCCGGVRPLLSGFIEAGLDAINPVQTNCVGMEPEGLKRDFGSKLCFWGGGCDTQSVLPNGSPAEVREHVLSRLPVMGRESGFIFQQIHNVMANVPPENIIAMMDAVAEYNGSLRR